MLVILKEKLRIKVLQEFLLINILFFECQAGLDSMIFLGPFQLKMFHNWKFVGLLLLALVCLPLYVWKQTLYRNICESESNDVYFTTLFFNGFVRASEYQF